VGWEASFVFALVVLAGIAMASGRVRMDMTAFLVVLTWIVAMLVIPLLFKF
jgi:hypothetical protein